MNRVFFYLVILLETLITGLILYSLLQPEHRIWPPKTDSSPGKWLMQLLFFLTSAGIILLGILDWRSFPLPGWVRGTGGLIWLVGLVLGARGMSTLGLENTTGSPLGLVVEGPYRWTRNPQYLGFILGLLGWGALAASIPTLIASLGACLPLVLVPRIEEPWLLDIYGESYGEYLKKVPRFLLLL